jgi:2-amino-4-hydroxy-6-hydroxymethyldihydropteridine diphosphokinase
MTQVFIGLGGNVGDVQQVLLEALQHIDRLPHTERQALSSFYRTPAWGKTDQDAFINAVAELKTGLAAIELLDAMLSIEKQFGRDREKQERWGPRRIDLDILMFGEQVLQTDKLKVPHPHIGERAFVLLPWAEIAPDCRIPGLGVVKDLLKKIDAAGIEQLP